MTDRYQNIQDIVDAARQYTENRVVAVAAAHGADVLECAVEARKLGLCDFLLIGDEGKIAGLLTEMGQNPNDWEVVDEKNDERAAEYAVRAVHEGKADIPMKGTLHTSVFMREILNKETGLLDKGAYVSAITVTELPWEGRLMLVTDPVMSIAPNYSEKVKIALNAIRFAHALGIKCPKVAFLAPVEVVNPAIQSCIDAAMLAKAADRKQLGVCVGDGPLALDVAVSEEAACIKGLSRKFDGGADILVVPDLNSGNILDKALRYMAHLDTGSALIGPRVPVVATSRSDSPKTKLNTIALAVIYSHACI